MTPCDRFCKPLMLAKHCERRREIHIKGSVNSREDKQPFPLAYRGSDVTHSPTRNGDLLKACHLSVLLKGWTSGVSIGVVGVDWLSSSGQVVLLTW